MQKSKMIPRFKKNKNEEFSINKNQITRELIEEYNLFIYRKMRVYY